MILAAEDIACSDYAAVAGGVVLEAIVAHFPARRETFTYQLRCLRSESRLQEMP